MEIKIKPINERGFEAIERLYKEQNNNKVFLKLLRYGIRTKARLINNNDGTYIYVLEGFADAINTSLKKLNKQEINNQLELAYYKELKLMMKKAGAYDTDYLIEVL